MTRLHKLSIMASIAAAMLFTACGAWVSSSDSDNSGYYAVSSGYNWAPGLPGAPYYYNPYWNSDIYPGAYLPGRPLPAPAYRPTYRPSISVNAPSGNVRPGFNSNSGISVLPDKIPVNDSPSSSTSSIVPPNRIPTHQITGGMPGIATLPAGSGLSTAGRH